jgi:RimJ/RimL family protein N-acetyltransferase
MSDLKTEFTQYAVQQLHPKLLEWYTPTELYSNLEPEITEATVEFFTPEFSSRFAHNKPVAGVAPERYTHRLFKVVGRRLIAGIRFFGGDITRPFVEVARISQPLENDSQRDAITEFLRSEFAEFAPTQWRIWQASHQPYQFADCAGDLRVLAGLLSEINTLPLPENAARVRLSRATNTDFYLRYVELYQQLYRERPWLPDVARTETLEDMQQYLETGQVFEIFVDGTWAGLTIAIRDAGWGVRGWLMVEIVLTAPFRGQDLAVAVQRLLAQQLEDAGKDCLFGSIGAVNLPMQKTATRVGRVDIGGYFFVAM